MEKQLCIMVLDDDWKMLDILNSVPKLESLEVATVDGNSVVALIEECRPDLIILTMAGFLGLQTLLLIRQCVDIPVITLNGRCEATLLQETLLVDDYARKPFRIIELPVRIRAKLKRSSQENVISQEVTT